MPYKTGAPEQRRASRRPTSKSKPSLLQRVRRRDLILLTGALSLACFSVITVALLILSFQSAEAGPELGPTVTPGPQPTHTVTHIQVTGLSQYRLAEAQAQTWSPDAQLIAASTNWAKVVNMDQIGSPGPWTYRFYSPDKERLYIIRVEADGNIEAIEHVVKITLPPPPLLVDTWAIDSPAALAIWLDYGGADLFQRNPGLEVLIQLRTLSNHPGPVWMIIGADKRTQDVHVVVVDAITGMVINTDGTN